MKHLVARVHMSVAAILLCCAANAQAKDAKQVQVDIGEQPVLGALKELGEQTGLQLLMRVDGVSIDNIVVQPVSGQLSLKVALDKLLANTGLTYEFVNDRTIRISRAVSRPTSSIQRSADSGSFRVAQIADATVTDTTGGGRAETAAASSHGRQDSQGAQMEQVIVTAEKREGRLQDVPVPVTPIKADALVNANQLRIQDYFTSVPGLTATPGDFHGSPMLSIRGVTTGGGFLQPTVGIVVDDVPYGSSTGTGGGFQAPDIDPSDLSRIEVLRGPQGTLYGASSIGGLLKFVTTQPSVERLSGHVQVGTSSVKNGDEAGYNLRGSANVPIGDSFAIRASGFTRRDPGYVDDPVLGLEGVNRTNAEGGRLSALWRVSENLSLRLGALAQHMELEGAPTVDRQPGLGDLQHSDLSGTGQYDTTFQAYTAAVDARLGGIELTSLSGYTINYYSDSVDFTPALAGLTQARFGVPGTPLHDQNKTKKFTEELRLLTKVGSKSDLLVGAFYTYEDSILVQDIMVANSTGQIINQWQHSAPLTTFEEYAAFADLTFYFTDRFDIQFGGRQSWNRQTFSNVQSGPFITQVARLPSDPFVYPEFATNENSFTYLVTPRYRVSPDLMLYMRFASGYRPGGPNTTFAVFNTARSFAPDKTQNYEVGIKGSILDGSLSYDASIYYIDWKDIQLNLTDPQTRIGYRSNAGRAESKGVEFSLQANPFRGMTITTWGAYNEAELAEPLPAISGALGRPGDRLPYSSKYSGSLSLNQEFPVGNAKTAFVGASASYVGERQGVFRSVALRQTFPSYTQVDLRAGFKYDTWALNAYLTNLTDERGVLTGGLGTSPNPLAFNYIQPRTVGLSLSKTF